VPGSEQVRKSGLDDEDAALILREMSDALRRPVEHDMTTTALSELLTEPENA